MAIYLNPLILYESKLKVTVIFLGLISKLCLLQQLFTNKDFSMTTKLCNNVIRGIRGDTHITSTLKGEVGGGG